VPHGAPFAFARVLKLAGKIDSMPAQKSTKRPSVVSPPTQNRSQVAWRRILDAGRSLLEAGGSDALTISAVCAEASVAPTAIYARVSGLTDLFWAIYEDSMHEIIKTYETGLQKAAKKPVGSKSRVAAVVTAVTDTFENHAKFLRAVIRVSLSDENMKNRGSDYLLDFAHQVADLLDPSDTVAGSDVARMLEQESILRTMYGGAWMSDKPESYALFQQRLNRMALSRLSIR
jgi:AcrR family transcriptional regulator